MPEIKITIQHKDNAALVGMQRPDCDVALFKVEGDLATAVAAVPGLVEKADARWAVSKVHRTTFKPTPPPVAVKPPANAKPAKPKSKSPAQPALDL